MKPAAFRYEAPRTVDAALDLLGDDAKVLAGGQSLVPVLNFRLARPEVVVDINGIAELAYLHRKDGTLHIGALTRQMVLERSELVGRAWPLLRQAVRHVGHAQIRARGTVGGSVAHADPTAELPVALTALDARFVLRSAGAGRTVTAEQFFISPLTTCLRADELLVEIEVPPLPSGVRTAFREYARTHGDFAIAGAAVTAAAGTHAAIALLGAGPTPIRARDSERAVLAGATAREAGALAAAGVESPHRRALMGALVREALEQAGVA